MVTVPSDQLYITESVNLTCLITLTPEVDEFSNLLVTWQGPQGATAGGLSVEISQNVYLSNLTLLAITTAATGNYSCSVVVESSSPFVVGANASTTAVLVVSGVLKLIVDLWGFFYPHLCEQVYIVKFCIVHNSPFLGIYCTLYVQDVIMQLWCYEIISEWIVDIILYITYSNTYRCAFTTFELYVPQNCSPLPS